MAYKAFNIDIEKETCHNSTSFSFYCYVSPHPSTHNIYSIDTIGNKGFTKDTYYYGADYIYKLERTGPINYNKLILKCDTYWDMNKQLSIPKLKVPDWNKYKN